MKFLSSVYNKKKREKKKKEKKITKNCYEQQDLKHRHQIVKQTNSEGKRPANN